jgi:hypothetical protein
MWHQGIEPYRHVALGLHDYRATTWASRGNQPYQLLFTSRRSCRLTCQLLSPCPNLILDVGRLACSYYPSQLKTGPSKTSPNPPPSLSNRVRDRNAMHHRLSKYVSGDTTNCHPPRIVNLMCLDPNPSIAGPYRQFCRDFGDNLRFDKICSLSHVAN